MKQECNCDNGTAEAIYNYFLLQKKFMTLINISEWRDGEVLVETILDVEGRKHHIFHTIVGRRCNEVLSKALAHFVSDQAKVNVAITFNDNGFILTTPTRTATNIFQALEMLKVCNLRETCEKALLKSEAMKRRFRHVATRSFLILKNYLGNKKSVGRQQLSAQILLGVCKRIPNFPLISETYREILEDAMDLKNAELFLRELKDGRRRLKFAKAVDLPSPFAHNLFTEGMSDAVIMQDRKILLEQLHAAVMLRVYRSEKNAGKIIEEEAKQKELQLKVVEKLKEKREKKSKASAKKKDRSAGRVYG